MTEEHKEGCRCEECFTEGPVFRVVRFYESGRRRTIKQRLYLSEARKHCRDPKTRGSGWFDGYEYMKGFAPKTES